MACSDRQKQVCYGCGKNGHTRRFCKRVEDNEGDQLDKYIRDTQASTVSVLNAIHSTSSTELKTATPVLQTDQDFLDELCEALDVESPMDMEHDQTRKSDGPDFNQYIVTYMSTNVERAIPVQGSLSASTNNYKEEVD
ncbi:hypothetical protein G6F46_010700 [Rhizopus delemar]|uniref:CCHC-type domain-containing protein n=2 Tax=Rhizopus TaxID=4842 RepID=A0A9P7CKI8_9FUNG|nr:hypothetical protein G6F36_015502 [Rhizopus arrhizus]KAG1449538.1 hypothetical protein G6F55_010125 [Rhizopus delemar]KAG1519469.1 hypothetical protein G6F52_008591 [Rhizopus delemar]KAG1544781.1 hypothetical protein G6F51_005859 [Rhizopus arrhizus]KAG1555461.1 hypothetical protein G6F49_007145 [Rhizopus delemar]